MHTTSFQLYKDYKAENEMLFVPAALLWQSNGGLIFVLSSITSLTKSSFPMKSPAMMLIHSFCAPGYCCLTQIFKHGRLRSVMSFSDPNGCKRMYLKFSVRLMPATKNFSGRPIRFMRSRYWMRAWVEVLFPHQYGMAGHSSQCFSTSTSSSYETMTW